MGLGGDWEEIGGRLGGVRSGFADRVVVRVIVRVIVRVREFGLDVGGGFG